MHNGSFERLLKQKNKSNDIVRKLKKRNASVSDKKFTIEYNGEIVSVADNKGNEWCFDYEDSMPSIAVWISGMLVSAGADVELKEL